MCVRRKLKRARSSSGTIHDSSLPFQASIASAKVRVVLYEKQIEWRGEVLDLHRAEYKAINPHAVAPTLVHEGRVTCESTVIMDYLEEAFPMPPLMPPYPHQRAMTRVWLKKTDELHASCAMVRFAIAFCRCRFPILPCETRDALHLCPA
jgi:glutathione S-transferase